MHNGYVVVNYDGEFPCGTMKDKNSKRSPYILYTAIVMYQYWKMSCWKLMECTGSHSQKQPINLEQEW
jgi:hypothetical protein